MYTQDFDPVSSSLGLTAIFAALPLITLFVLLGGVGMKAQWASLIALGVAIAVALIVYGMPVGQTALSATEGAAFGLFPVVTAIWVYNMTVETGHFAVLRRSFGAISEDQRVQAVIVAFCFGALMEALAGFGTPVAITAVMLIALGFKPIKAAAVALVANTAPVAFGAIAIPITTLSEVTGLDKGDLGAMVGRQTPFLALIVPLILMGMVDGRRGVRQAWPVAAVGGVAHMAAGRAAARGGHRPLRASRGGGRLRLRHDDGAGGRPSRRYEEGPAARGRPGLCALSDHHRGLLDRADQRDQGLDGGLALDDRVHLARPRRAQPRRRAAHESDLHVQLAARGGHPDADLRAHHDGRDRAGARPRGAGLRPHGRPAQVGDRDRGRGACARLRDAPVRLDDHARTLGRRRRRVLRVPVVADRLARRRGHRLGYVVNALFGALQVTAAKDAGISQTLLAAANSSGGVLGKMISPQNLAIGAAAVGLAGREGDLFRKVLVWSLVLVLMMCVLVYLQSIPVLEWMVA